jgi:hypothetical protein
LSASKDRKALNDYVEYLNSLFNRTISTSHISVLFWDKHTKEAHIARCLGQSIQPIELRPKSWLHFQQILHMKSQKVVIDFARYHYSLSPDPDDEDSWVFRYDYHLSPKQGKPHAHLHVNGNWLNIPLNAKVLKKIHFPTERMSIEKVIAHLIIEYGVRTRRNWQKFLAESHCKFASKLRIDPPMFP